MSISLVGEHDVNVLLNIENKIGKKLIEFTEIEEKDVMEILPEVSVARRLANMVF